METDPLADLMAGVDAYGNLCSAYESSRATEAQIERGYDAVRTIAEKLLLDARIDELGRLYRVQPSLNSQAHYRIHERQADLRKQREALG